MRALKFITGHVIYNPAYTYKFKLKTTQMTVLSRFLQMFIVLLGMYNFASAISYVHCNEIKSSITIELGTGTGVLALCYFWVLVYIKLVL